MNPIGKNNIEFIQLLNRLPAGTIGQKVRKIEVKRHICLSLRKEVFRIKIELICFRNR
tara:strand:- start:73 stop:246 length:174 start_codon:yes stop_codon:yes gene_type:complete